MSEQKKESRLNTESPCIRNCCLDNDDICLGCFRHIDEITGWSQFSDQQKSQVLSRCQQRKNSRG